MRARRTIGAAALLLTAVLLGACGDDRSKKELSKQTAASLRSTLDEVEQSVESQDCTSAIQGVSSLRSQVEGLPTHVDGDLRDALAASAGRLEDLVGDECRPAQEAPTGTTADDGVQPQGDPDQADKPEKDKKPKKEKPNKDEQPPPDTGGSGQEDPGLNEQGGAVPPGQE